MDINMDDIRVRARSLGIHVREDMEPPALLRAIQSAQGQQPCFNQLRCQPSQYQACEWKDSCRTRPEAINGLVLSDNMIAGHEVAHLLASAYAWNMQVLNQDRQAYHEIAGGSTHVVVADIDHTDLGGLALLAHIKRHWPAMETYAMTRDEDAYAKQLARNIGGCRAFFYLSRGKFSLDMHRGWAAHISEDLERRRISSLQADARANTGPSAGDQAALFSLLNRNRHA